MSLLALPALGKWSARCSGGIIGCYYTAQMSFLNGAWGPPPELFSAYRRHRAYRMRLMCYRRHYRRHGQPGFRLPMWRMPRHPIRPRRQPPGQQAELRFTDCL